MAQPSTHHILIADDDINILAALKLLLSSEGYQVTLASQPTQVVEVFKAQDFDCVLLDLNFNLDTTSGDEGLALIEKLSAIDDSVPLIVMTGWATIELAVKTMQVGARDFIQKPWENERVLQIIKTHIALAQQQHHSAMLDRENQLLKAENAYNDPIIAASSAMQQVLETANQVAKSDINVLITGENGTGKSLLAQYIHQQSSRANKTLISVNMGAITESLFESEMFGHVKGAFTDAKETRIGRFELADGGSLFLDEIGNIPMSQQAKLLRVLESQQFEKVGASKTQHTDARIISATNANINNLIIEGEFRQDLLYRLNTVEISLPALRDRRDDIVALATQFLAKYADKYQKTQLQLTSSAEDALLSYGWPGNIRELSHVIERAVVLATDHEITPIQLAIHPTTEQVQASRIAEVTDTEQTLEALEKRIIVARIAAHQGNMQDAYKSLGLSRSAFYRRIDKYKL